MNVLVTGFEAFGAVTANPSAAMVAALAARDFGATVQVRGVTLKTEYDWAGRRIRELMDDVLPELVLCLGVARRSPEIKLERVALNLNDCADADNAGVVRRGMRIASDGPEAYFSRLPLERLEDRLKDIDERVIISNHAGAYVCNHVFYTASHHAASMASPPVCGFIHVPLPGEEGIKVNGAEHVETLSDVVAEVVRFVAGDGEGS
ncbi:Pyrrolidone-carboxylate peptidase [Planctomycetes bacterium Pan216]|uniref:Pyrrolidone-carboxylate peptidase n=1 Tax=Kolteria novifilia TaxID=2527975 RepID=A0A518B7N2_9BACT|nr:Pyrrolidone-carboxylate peptidase [Planctomycetes bacterium Pan216]